jgi:hypothetical protein
MLFCKRSTFFLRTLKGQNMKRLTILISTLLFLPFQIANAQVGQAYYVQVSNPTALIQALDTLNDTQAGRSDNIDVRLEISVSNGTSAATHNIVVNGFQLRYDVNRKQDMGIFRYSPSINHK